MKRKLKKTKLINADNLSGDLTKLKGNGCNIRGRVGDLHGDISGIRGDVTGISGYVTGLSGDLDKCEITKEEREAGIDIRDLIEEE